MDRKRAVVIAIGVLWAVAVAIGLKIMLDYQTTPGHAAPEAQGWPAAATLARGAQPTLVMFGHPHCPCTRASVEELARLMAECQGRLTAYVVFVRPDRFNAGWEQGDLWTAASRIPGVRVVADAGGSEARHFNALTSGQTFLFGADGALLFSGGITAARGHEGDNAGRTAIVSFIKRGVAERTNTPVFGCALN